MAAVFDGQDVDEDSLTLGEVLGSGGQGRVLRVTGHPASLVFKQYIVGGADPAAMRELVDMPSTLRGREQERLLAASAWPLARVMRQGRLRGFLMRPIPDHFFGLNAAGDRKLRELQFLLYPAKPMWGSIVPGLISPQVRLGVAAEFARLMWLLHGKKLVFGDISMSNVMWAAGGPATIFVIDCDGIRKLGSLPVLPQAETPDWNDPHQPRSGPDLDTDRYKLALLVGRVLCGKAYIRPGDALDLLPGLPDPVVDRVRPLWQHAAGGPGKRPGAAQWLTALEGRREIPMPPKDQNGGASR